MNQNISIPEFIEIQSNFWIYKIVWINVSNDKCELFAKLITLQLMCRIYKYHLDLFSKCRGKSCGSSR